MPSDHAIGFETAYEEWNRREFDAWVERFTDDVEWDISAAWFDQDPVHGRDALRRWCDGIFRVWDEFRIEKLETLEDADDRLVVLIRLIARGLTTGARVDQRFRQVLEFRGDKISRARIVPP
jgi:ketosteroid isomerase-like protein